LLGTKDLVVVDTPDALLVCPKDRVQEVKKLMSLLPRDVI
jgi:mannose-1-phosphate guanylyltransferase